MRVISVTDGDVLDRDLRWWMIGMQIWNGLMIQGKGEE